MHFMQLNEWHNFYSAYKRELCVNRKYVPSNNKNINSEFKPYIKAPSDYTEDDFLRISIHYRHDFRDSNAIKSIY